MTTTVGGYDPRARFRLFVNGVLVDEAWIDVNNPDVGRHADTIKDRHARLAQAADDAGKVWMAESFDPALPEDMAYNRMGTDASMMVDPHPL